MACMPAYEDFHPPTERKDDDILLVHIPGFAKEQIKITFRYFSRMIRVQGERPVDICGRKWKRFNEVFQVPENCMEEKIRAEFQDGVLTITLPKQTIITAAAPKQQPQQQEACREIKIGEKQGQEKEEESCKLTPAAAPTGKPRDVKEMAAAAMKTVKLGLSMEGKDDRQLLVNVEVAALVIVAIGAFVIYKIRSKSIN